MRYFIAHCFWYGKYNPKKDKGTIHIAFKQEKYPAADGIIKAVVKEMDERTGIVVDAVTISNILELSEQDYKDFTS